VQRGTRKNNAKLTHDATLSRLGHYISSPTSFRKCGEILNLCGVIIKETMSVMQGCQDYEQLHIIMKSRMVSCSAGSQQSAKLPPTIVLMPSDHHHHSLIVRLSIFTDTSLLFQRPSHRNIDAWYLTATLTRRIRNFFGRNLSRSSRRRL
jgi:hypothetical protein